MHYQRAYLDRDVASDGGPIRFAAATQGRKADNIDLRMSGARLDRYRANPILGYGHRYYSREDLPIGRSVRTEVDGDRLMIDVEFDQADEFAQRVERKYRDGFLNAVSVSFDVVRWEGGNGSYWTGGVAEEWELTEVSAVPVPMDGDAVVAGGRAAGLLDPADRMLIRALAEEFGEDAVLAAIRTHLLGAPEPESTPEPAAPVQGVDDDAARDILAACTLKGSS